MTMRIRSALEEDQLDVESYSARVILEHFAPTRYRDSEYGCGPALLRR